MNNIVNLPGDIELNAGPEVETEVLMRQDGAVTMKGMEILEQYWRDKPDNHGKPKVYIIDIDDDCCEIIDRLPKDVVNSDTPTFFLCQDEDFHWRSGFAYKGKGKDDPDKVYLFDSAPLENHPAAPSDEIDSDTDSDIGSDTSSKHYSAGDTIEIYRNQVLKDVKKPEVEIAHQATETGCGIFALKYVHKLIDMYGAKKDIHNTPTIKKVNSGGYEKEYGVDYTFEMPDELLYLSHPSSTRASKPEVTSKVKRRDKPGADARRNYSLEYFTLKAAKKLQEYADTHREIPAAPPPVAPVAPVAPMNVKRHRDDNDERQAKILHDKERPAQKSRR